jgi:hypothetical protein
MRNAIIQYVLSADQRKQGFSIESPEDDLIELCYKGKRFYSCSPFVQVQTIQKEIWKYQIEYNIET